MLWGTSAVHLGEEFDCKRSEDWIEEARRHG